MLEKLPLGPGSFDNNEHLAIEAWDGTFSYGQLALAVAKRASLLEQTQGPIAVLASASADYVISFLAGIKLKRPIMPLSPDAPAARISQVFQHANPGVVILSGDAAARQNEPWLTNYSCLLTNLADDQLSLSQANVATFDYAELCAYIITTSGSTGEPKLIAGSRAGLDHFIAWEVAELPQNLRVSFLSAPVFDVSLRDMLLPLCSQGVLCIPKSESLLDASRLAKWLSDSKVNLVHIVPTLLRTLYPQLKNSASQLSKSLRYIASAGEPLLKADVIKLRSLIGPEINVLNLYGPSETSLAKCCYVCPQDVPDSSPLPIGQVLPDTEVVLFDSDRRAIANEGTGQIGIATKFPSLGYIRNGEIVEPDWLRDADGKAFFPTGDMGSFAANGDLLIHGRLDRQLKIRGQRVEPGEIEAKLRDLDGVKNGAVVASDALPGGTALLAYVVLSVDVPNAQSLIREQLATQLPDYMVPARVIVIDGLPLTRSGKVDVKALPKPGRDRPELANAFKAPRGELQIKMAELWSEQLGIDSPGATDTFFDLGGTSLQAQHITAELSEYLQRDLAVTDFFANPSIAALSAWIKEAPVVEWPQRSRTRASNSAVAIVGLAGSFPGSSNVDELWDALLHSDDQISMFSSDELDPMLDPATTQQDNYVAARGQMPDIDAFDAALFGITPREAQIMDPQQRVFLQTSWHALEDAAFDPSRFDGKIGVYAGTGDNTYLWKVILRHPNALEELGEHPLHLANERDYLATRVAYKLGLTGPAINVATACSTSLVAIGQAVDSIRSGHCDAAIAGGVFVPCPHSAGHLYQPGGFGSSDGHCRPFDADASGTVFSSGSAAVVLRRLDDALANGDRIYGVVRGFGLNNDGADKMSFMAPSAAGQADAIRSALSDADLTGSDIGWVEAHGTATPIGDPIEVAALNDALGEAPANSRVLGSVKGHLGHLDAAAGATAVIKMAKAMQSGVFPGTAHFKRANSQVDLETGGFTVPSSPVDWRSHNEKMTAGISSFGVGGTNAHLIVESHDARSPSASREQEVFLLSAASADALSELHMNLAAYFSQNTKASISDAAYSLARGRKKLEYRGIVTVGPDRSVAHAFEAANAELEVLRAADGDRVAFVFPGQGSQHVGMASGLYQRSAIYKDVIDAGARYLQPALGIDLRDLLFADPDDLQSQTDLAATQFAQPALYLMQCALAAHWQSWGVMPSLVMGHSIGEFAAAHVAGVMSFETGLELVRERGRLCAAQEPGAMLSVRAGASKIQAYLGESLELAAINAPELVVVSGAAADIESLQTTLQEQEIACSKLQTSHAFHSYMMEPARAEFERCVAEQSLQAPSIDYVSTLTGEFIDGDIVMAPEYWGRHLRHSVQFSAAVETLLSSDCTIALEVGPRFSASTLIRQHVEPGSDFRVVSSLNGATQADEDWDCVLDAAGRLWAAGVGLQLNELYAAEHRQIVSLPGYPFAKTRFWLGQEFSAPDAVSVSNQPLTSELDANQHLLELIERGSGLKLPTSSFSKTFVELGLDSLFLTQFGITLQREFGLRLSVSDLMGKYSSVNALNTRLKMSVASIEAATPVAVHRPPQDDAFVGLTADRKLAWFVPDPAANGQFIEVGS